MFTAGSKASVPQKIMDYLTSTCSQWSLLQASLRPCGLRDSEWKCISIQNKVRNKTGMLREIGTQTEIDLQGFKRSLRSTPSSASTLPYSSPIRRRLEELQGLVPDDAPCFSLPATAAASNRERSSDEVSHVGMSCQTPAEAIKALGLGEEHMDELVMIYMECKSECCLSQFSSRVREWLALTHFESGC